MNGRIECSLRGVCVWAGVCVCVCVSVCVGGNIQKQGMEESERTNGLVRRWGRGTCSLLCFSSSACHLVPLFLFLFLFPSLSLSIQDKTLLSFLLPQTNPPTYLPTPIP